MTDETKTTTEVVEDETKRTKTYDPNVHDTKNTVPFHVYENTKEDMLTYKQDKKSLEKEVKSLKSDVEKLNKSLGDKEADFNTLNQSIQDSIAMNEYHTKVSELFSKNNINADPVWLSSYLSEDKKVEDSLKAFVEQYPHVKINTSESRSSTFVGNPNPTKADTKDDKRPYDKDKLHEMLLNPEGVKYIKDLFDAAIVENK